MKTFIRTFAAAAFLLVSVSAFSGCNNTVNNTENIIITGLQNSAEKGDAKAQTALGVRYEKGDGVEKNPVKAVSYYKKAAGQGHAEAQSRLGYCYANGIGVTPDEQTAFLWYQRAAEQGYAAAQFYLGYCYDGDDVAGTLS